MEATATQREQELKAREIEDKARTNEFLALRRKVSTFLRLRLRAANRPHILKFEESDKLVKQLHSQYLDAEAEVIKAQANAANADNRRLEAEEKREKAAEDLESERKTSATKIAQAYRILKKRNQTGSRNSDEEQIANILLDERGSLVLHHPTHDR